MINPKLRIESDGIITEIYIDGVKVERATECLFHAEPVEVICNVEKFKIDKSENIVVKRNELAKELITVFKTRKNEYKETNKKHFFGDRMIADTVMLLTWDDHRREECRLFKKTLKEMSANELIKWLYSEKDNRFNW